MRIGLLGGSFNPLHKGHLKLATAARRELKLSCVYIIPSKNPFKPVETKDALQARLKPLQLAFKGKRGFHISLSDLERPGPSYSVRMVQHYKKKFPKADLFLIMGSDSVKNFPRWRRAEVIAKIAQLVVGKRPGYTNNLPQELYGRPVAYLKSAFPKISSTKLRQK